MKISILCAFAAYTVSAQTPPPMYCGETPELLYNCIGNPKLVKPEVAQKCTKSVTACDRMTCIFRESGLMDGAKVDRQKAIAYFDDYVKENPEWTVAVNGAKTACLSGDLPAQGAFLNCPAFDIMHCALTAFVRNTQRHQWATAPQCIMSRDFAAACPICPEDCFAPVVPYGSCNACLSLPRSP